MYRYIHNFIEPVSSSALIPLAEASPPAWIINNHPPFTKSKILDVRWQGSAFQYLFDWKGYGQEECS